MWGADEHFHEVVVQRVEELALKAPFKLWMVEIARMHLEIVGVYGDGFVLELDDDFDPFVFGAGGEVQKWVLVELKLGLDAVEPFGWSGHLGILADFGSEECEG